MNARGYSLIVMGMIIGCLITIMVILMRQPINPPNSNYHCAHIYTEREAKNKWRGDVIRFDSGIWWKGVNPVGFSLTEHSDICVWN